jgi:hypothetical protein
MRKNIAILVREWPLDIPVERAVKLNLKLFELLIGEGLTWPSIAAALTEAGARHKNGLPISSCQINTVFLRARKAARLVSSHADRPPAAGIVSIEKCDALGPPVAKTTELFGTVSEPSCSPSAGSRRGTLSQKLAEARHMKDARKSDFGD